MKTEQILVVDDEKRIVEKISLCLKREGLQTTGAHDGDEAVNIFKQQKFDLVLLDVNMPGMDGYEVMDQLIAINSDILIIMITGYASVESAVRALKNGAWDYLKKPFEYADLTKTVKNALAQKKLIEEQKVISAMLEASEKQNEYMVNNSPDLIFLLDENGCFAFVNHQFERVLGFTKEELIGTSFEDIIHKGDFSKAAGLTWLDQDGARVNDGLDMHFRFKKVKTKTSKYDPYEAFAFMELKATPMCLPASGRRSEFKGVYAVARDVTERVALEDQLRQSQKMEAIGTLAGGIAHDFNNILMGIQGYASLVKAGFDRDSEEFKRLANIDEYVFNGAEMARQLLGFAQKTSQETCCINLNYLLKMSAKMFGRTKKDITIEQYLDKELLGTIVDEGQIKQVLMNLFVNAWQAMPDGGKIIIKSENVVVEEFQKNELGLETSGAYVKITVSDAGIGMEDAIMARIFEPFFTTKRRGKGTGLGLATAYGIMKGHKGILRVDSKPGQGSSFMFFLPAVPAKTEVDIIKKSEEKELIFAQKGIVLLVDDEKNVRKVCSEMLETLGYQVRTASDGIEAMEIIESNDLKIDLVFLDMIMPRMNGHKTFDKIKTFDPDMKILVSSGYSSAGDIEKIMKKGCDEFIRKPFDLGTLSEKINKVMKISHKSLNAC